MFFGKKKKVFVGLSGGVDSAVSALLLKKKGYDVVGCFIKTWTPPGYVCPIEEDRRDSMRVAAFLKIPWMEIDAEESYKKNVSDYVLNEYKNGRTPNGDVFCNKAVKFGTFYEKVITQKDSYLATGHYAKIVNGQMLKSVDPLKDQTYFLWSINKEKLKNVIFPLGDLKKDEVRKIAKINKLPNAEKPDSQGICFLGEIDLKKFLKEQIQTIKEGNVLDEQGNIVGSHQGAELYTIGERHGFNIFKNTKDPYFVVQKDIHKNILIVSNQNHKQSQNIKISDVNWLVDTISLPKTMNAVFNYHGQEFLVELTNDLNIKFVDKTPKFVSSGQSVVFYKDNKVLGGAIVNTY